MLTIHERVQLMLDFAHMDLERLRAGDWLNLREDLEAFILGTRAKQPSPWGRVTPETAPIRTAPLREPSPAEMTPAAFQALQAEVRGFLEGFIPRDQWFREQTTLGEARIHLGELDVAVERRGLITVITSTRESVLLTLILLLPRLPPDALLRCPECMTIFLRNRNQRYCSRRCVNRVNQRDWRAAKRQPAATP